MNTKAGMNADDLSKMFQDIIPIGKKLIFSQIFSVET